MADETVPVRQVWQRVAEASASGGFDDPQALISCTALDLDPTALEEIAVLVSDLLDQARKIEAEAAIRLAELPDAERERTELAVLHLPRRRS